MAPCCSAQSCKPDKAGISDEPSSVKRYSTRGGTSANTRRSTIPARSSSRSRFVSSFCVIGSTAALELPEANRPARLVQREKDVNRPFMRDQLDRPARRTVERGRLARPEVLLPQS